MMYSSEWSSTNCHCSNEYVVDIVGVEGGQGVVLTCTGVLQLGLCLLSNSDVIHDNDSIAITERRRLPG